MRFEKWRGMPLVLTMAAVGLVLAWANSVRADGYRLHPTIPREVAAIDLTTGGEFMAPPVPYGHYAKDHILGCASCRLHGLLGCAGCGHGGKGCGHGHGLGHGCGSCGGRGCGLCSGLGHGNAVADPSCGGGRCGHHRAGKFAPCDTCVGPAGVATTYAGPVATSQSQAVGMSVVQPSSQSPCGQMGCGMQGHHRHKGLGGHGILAGCGDPGCGLCHGKGSGCGFCGGKGCSHCLSGLHAKLAGLLHHNPKIDYFVGAGGPVPITPGYVPYVVATRSPRDFFSFPPMNPFDP